MANQTDNVDNAQLGIPGSIAVGLLRSVRKRSIRLIKIGYPYTTKHYIPAVPHLDDSDEGGSDAGFERSQQKASCHQATIVLARSHATEYSAPWVQSAWPEEVHLAIDLPAEYHRRNELASRELDEEVRNDRLPYQLCHIDDSTKPAVLVSHKVGILNQAEYCSVAQCRLVE